MTMTGRWRTFAGLAGATLASQGAGVLAAPVLTRLYAPAEFGTYAAGLSIVSIVTVVACLRYEQAIPLPADAVTVASLVTLCAVLTVGSTIVLGLVLLVLGGALGAVLGVPADRLTAPILVAVLGGALYAVAAGWAVRAGAFGEIARTRVTQALGLVVLQVGFGLARAGSAGLLLGDAFGRSAGTLRLARRLWSAEASAFRRVSLGTTREAALRYRRFATLSTPSALLDVVAITAPTLIVVALFGPTVGGWYLLASRIAAIPNGLAAASLGLVYLGDAARQTREDPARLRAVFLEAVRRLFLVGLFPTLGLVVAAPWFFPLVFGARWAEAGLYAVVLAPMSFAQLISSPVSGTLVVLERQGLHLARELGSITVLAIALGVVIGGRLEPRAAVAVLSLAGTVNALVYLGVMWAAVTRGPARRAAPESR